jgi:hypothetical protein
MSQEALQAFEEARYALKDPSRSEAEQNQALCKLAAELGTTRPERGTLIAMRSVIDKIERPEAFPRDQDAWEMHGARPRSYKTWKQRINLLVLSMAVDMLEEEAFLEFTAYHSVAPTVDCWAGVSGLTREEEKENRQVEIANKDARTLLAAHASAYIARNQEHAAYEGWVALLHPENVRVDDRLLQPNCEHRRIWEAALAAPPPAKKSSCTRAHHSFVELTIGSFFVVAVSASELLLVSAQIPFEATAAGMTQSRRETFARMRKGDLVSVLTVPVCAVAAALELGFLAAVLGLRVAEEVLFCALLSVGTLLHGMFALSPYAGSKAARRLLAIRRAMHRRMRGKRVDRAQSLSEPLTEASASAAQRTMQRTNTASTALMGGAGRDNGKPGTSGTTSPFGETDAAVPQQSNDPLPVVVGIPIEERRQVSSPTRAPPEQRAREAEHDDVSFV